jgi:hypothetical protein
VKEALLCGRDLRDLARDGFDSGAGEPPAAIKKEEVLLKAPERPEGVLDNLDRATRGEDDHGIKVNDIKVNDKVNKVNDRVSDKVNDKVNGIKVDDIKVGNPGAGFPREGTAHGGPGGERASPYGGPGGGAGTLDRDPGITRFATFGVEQDTLLEAGEKQFAAGEISARTQVKMKETAEAYLGKRVTHAVVTVPAIACALYGGSGPGGTAGLDYTEVGN